MAELYRASRAAHSSGFTQEFASPEPLKHMVKHMKRPTPSTPQTRAMRWGQKLASAALASLALTATALHAQEAYPQATAAIKPDKDAFYRAPDMAALSKLAPGEILRYRPIPITSTYKSTAKAGYQLMYRSNDQKGKPAAAITTVLVPSAPANGHAVSYQAYYDSLYLECSASYMTVEGTMLERSFVNPHLKSGSLVLLPDYEGLKSMWLAGRNAGHMVLDGVRAAQRFDKVNLSSNARIALQGYSSGGQATAWAAEMAKDYAPELNIVGAAYGSVPVRLDTIARRADGGLFSAVVAGAVVSLSRAYPELDPQQYANEKGLAIIEDVGNRCLVGILQGKNELVFKYAFKKIGTYMKDPNFLNLPEIQAILEDNRLGKGAPNMPLFVYQGLLDEVMIVRDIDAVVSGYCAKGTKVQYTKLPAADHLILGLNPGRATQYIQDRLAGKLEPSNCK